MLTKNPRAEPLAVQMRRLVDELAGQNPDPDKAAALAGILRALARFEKVRSDFNEWLGPAPKRRGGERPNSGRRKEWTDDRLYQLLIDHRLCQCRNPGKSDSWVCRFMTHKRVLNGRYAKLKPETIRHKLKLAWRAKTLSDAMLDLVKDPLNAEEWAFLQSDPLAHKIRSALVRHGAPRVGIAVQHRLYGYGATGETTDELQARAAAILEDLKK